MVDLYVSKDKESALTKIDEKQVNLQIGGRSSLYTESTQRRRPRNQCSKSFGETTAATGSESWSTSQHHLN